MYSCMMLSSGVQSHFCPFSKNGHSTNMCMPEWGATLWQHCLNCSGLPDSCYIHHEASTQPLDKSGKFLAAWITCFPKAHGPPLVAQKWGPQAEDVSRLSTSALGVKEELPPTKFLGQGHMQGQSRWSQMISSGLTGSVPVDIIYHSYYRVELFLYSLSNSLQNSLPNILLHRSLRRYLLSSWLQLTQ